MSCSICFEKVKTKPGRRNQVFGILPKCSHCFCFACLKKWRSNRDVAESASQSCPECRTRANYVYRSKIWYEDKDKKAAFIAKRNKKMRNTDCRSFKNGLGNCKRANQCMYRHVTVDGYSVDLGSPIECPSLSFFDNDENFSDTFSESIPIPLAADSDSDFDRIYANYMNILAIIR